MKRIAVALLFAVSPALQAQSAHPCAAFANEAVREFTATGAVATPPRLRAVAEGLRDAVKAGKVPQDVANIAMHSFAAGYCFAVADSRPASPDPTPRRAPSMRSM